MRHSRDVPPPSPSGFPFPLGNRTEPLERFRIRLVNTFGISIADSIVRLRSLARMNRDLRFGLPAPGTTGRVFFILSKKFAGEALSTLAGMFSLRWDTDVHTAGRGRGEASLETQTPLSSTRSVNSGCVTLARSDTFATAREDIFETILERKYSAS